MNLMVVSEKHGMLIVGVDSELHVYTLDPVAFTIPDLKRIKKVALQNDGVSQVSLTTLYSTVSTI